MLAIHAYGVGVDKTGLTLDFIDTQFFQVTVVKGVDSCNVFFAVGDQFRPVKTIVGVRSWP